LIKSQPKAIWAGSFALTLLSVVSFLRLSPSVIETDLEKLRDKTSMTEGSGFYSRFVDEIFQRNLTPMIVLPKNREDAREMAKRLKAKKASEGATSMLASVQTLDDFVPEDQVKKIRLLSDIKRLLPENILKRLAPVDKSRVKALLDPKTHHAVTQAGLPPLILKKFTEKDGSIGKMVVIEPPIGRETLDGTRMLGMVTEVRQVADSVSPGTAVAGVLPISADLISSITRDGPIAAMLAFLAVVLLVVFLFRNAETIYLVLFSLVLGFLWMCGFVLLFGVKVNFLNFIAFPITFGIGVDYGVNIFQRYKEEGTGSIIRVIRDTGGAVGLCSLTTIIGYSSLLMAGNQAFVSFGLFCVIGEITCVIAAIFSLPAYLILRDQRKNKKAHA
jgi:predicted RND superfamily exporter protein